MRKFLISTAVLVSTLGLAACTDVDDGSTGAIDTAPGTEQPATPADPMTEPAPVQ